MFLGKLLTYSKNNNGPNIEPCGMPEVTFSQPDLHPDITALCCRPYKYGGPTIKQHWVMPHVDLPVNCAARDSMIHTM